MLGERLARFKALLVVFLAGFAYEAGCVVWVHASEKNWIATSVGLSCFCGAMTIVGVEGFLKSRAAKLSYVLGFGAGTLTMMLARRLW